jgi:hypothetical protein
MHEFHDEPLKAKVLFNDHKLSSSTADQKLIYFTALHQLNQ